MMEKENIENDALPGIPLNVLTDDNDLNQKYQDVVSRKASDDLMSWAQDFAFGDAANDRPTEPAWAGIKVSVPEIKADKAAENAADTIPGERPWVIPNEDDQRRGKGGIFGNAVQAAVNGAVESVNNTLELAYQAGAFWDKNFGGNILPDELPDIPIPFDVPDTTANAVISSVSQFLIPFGTAGKLMKAAKLGTNISKSFPKAMKYARPAVQGALADLAAFDGHEARLSDLIQDVPVLRNPVAEYMQSNEDDGELEGRFKNSIEGLALGGLADGLFAGLRAVKASRRARAAAKAAGYKPVEEAFIPKVEKSAFSALGDTDEGLFFLKNMDRIADSPVVSINSTKEIGNEKKFRKKTFDLLDQFIGTKIYNQSLGADIEIRKSSIDKYKRFSSKIDKQLIAKYIPEILEKAEFALKEKPYDLSREPNIRAYYKGNVPILLDNKKSYVALTVKEDDKGKLFWDAQVKENPRRTVPDTKPGVYGGDEQASFFNNMSYSGKKVNDSIYINWARIDTPEDVKSVMNDLVQKRAPDIEHAQRGVMSFEDIRLNSMQEDAFKVLQERRMGQPLNAEQTLAARRLWAASGEKLNELAKLSYENPSEANLFMLRKQMATHYAIQKEIIAARTETARALAQWRIPSGSSEEVAEQLRTVLDAAGGDALTRKMARDILSMTQAGQVKEVDKMIEGGWFAKAVDTWNEARIAGLLTNSTTHIVNFSSNMLNVGVALADRINAVFMAKVLGKERGAVASEIYYQFLGNLAGVKDGLRYAWKTVKTGMSENPYATKFDIPPVIRSETYGLNKDSFWGKGVDSLGTIVRLPFRLLEGSDDFSKAVFGRGELYAQSVRRASWEMADGKITKEAFKKRVSDLIENPPADLKIAAKQSAEYHTFTGDPPELVKGLGRLARSYPIVRFILPFVKTPGNVLNYALEHSAFAPLSRQFRADLAAGGIRAETALGKMTTGAILTMVSADLALNGLITGGGPSDTRELSALRRTGWQPYSLKIGDKYYSFSRFEPLATNLSLVADMTEALDYMSYNQEETDENDEDVQGAVSLVLLKSAAAVMDKTYLSGMMGVVDALADPTELKAEKLAADFAVSMIPAVSSFQAALGAVARTSDPYAKDARTVIDRIRSNIPGLSKDVPNRLDLFGRKMTRATGDWKYDLFIPVRTSIESEAPIDKEMLEQGAFISMPNRIISIQGGKIDLRNRPVLYNEYVELAGNGAKIFDGKGTFDFLNDVVSGKDDYYGYAEMNNEGLGVQGSKAEFIRAIVNKGREAARIELLNRHPDLFLEIQRSLEKKMPAY